MRSSGSSPTMRACVSVAAAADRVLALHHGTLHSERHLGGSTVAVIDAIDSDDVRKSSRRS